MQMKRTTRGHGDMGTRGKACRRIPLVPMSSCLLVLVICATTLGQATGLDSLSDDALMNELASRGLNTLLDRAFEVNKVSETERQGRRTLIALSKLSDPNTTLTASQRQ